jgi:fatty acid desaturase
VGWLCEISEHYPLFETGKNNLQMTRNRFAKWWEAWFFSMHNENYHLTHHLYASIPFWNLPKAHSVMMKDEEYALYNSCFGGIFSCSTQFKNGKTVLNQIKEVFVTRQELI